MYYLFSYSVMNETGHTKFQIKLHKLNHFLDIPYIQKYFFFPRGEKIVLNELLKLKRARFNYLRFNQSQISFVVR